MKNLFLLAISLLSLASTAQRYSVPARIRQYVEFKKVDKGAASDSLAALDSRGRLLFIPKSEIIPTPRSISGGNLTTVDNTDPFSVKVDLGGIATGDTTLNMNSNDFSITDFGTLTINETNSSIDIRSGANIILGGPNSYFQTSFLGVDNNRMFFHDAAAIGTGIEYKRVIDGLPMGANFTDASLTHKGYVDAQDIFKEPLAFDFSFVTGTAPIDGEFDIKIGDHTDLNTRGFLNILTAEEEAIFNNLTIRAPNGVFASNLRIESIVNHAPGQNVTDLVADDFGNIRKKVIDKTPITSTISNTVFSASINYVVVGETVNLEITNVSGNDGSSASSLSNKIIGTVPASILPVIAQRGILISNVGSNSYSNYECALLANGNVVVTVPGSINSFSFGRVSFSYIKQ